MNINKIIGIHCKNPSIDKSYPIIIDEKNSSGNFKMIDYHATSKQLLAHAGNQFISALAIPGNYNEHPKNDYNVLTLIKHIRLLKDNTISRCRIFILGGNEKILEAIITDGLDDGVVLETENLISGHDFTPINEKQLTNIINLINDKPGNSDHYSHHNLSNKWAPYRIATLLNNINISLHTINIATNLENEISKEIYFKKLIREEFYSIKSKINYDKDIKLIKNKLDYIWNNKFKFGIIEDELDNGWKMVYQGLFGVNSTSFLYDQLNNYDKNDEILRKKNFELFMKRFNSGDIDLTNYDIILLDLRLWEETKNNSSDILNISNLSGMKILKVIRNKYPTLPVIICSASNKSWSYEHAIDLGANGYWCKESPEFGVDFRYNLSNTIDLIKTIEESIRWSSEISDIYSKLDFIINIAEEKNYKIAQNIKKKDAIVVGQLHNKKSNYLEIYFGQSGYELTYLVLWSLGNDIIDLVLKKRDDGINIIYYCKKNGREYRYCKKNSDGYVLLFGNYNLEKYFPEKYFMSFVLKIIDCPDTEFNELRKLRNSLDYIHGHPTDTISEFIKKEKNKKISLNNLKQIINFYKTIVEHFCDNN